MKQNPSLPGLTVQDLAKTYQMLQHKRQGCMTVADWDFWGTLDGFARTWSSSKTIPIAKTKR